MLPHKTDTAQRNLIRLALLAHWKIDRCINLKKTLIDRSKYNEQYDVR